MSSFTVWHWCGIFLAFAAVFIAIFATAQKSSLENFSVGGRASGPWLVAGALVGTIVGGLAGIHFMQILFPVSELTGTLLLLVIVVLYVLAGGIRGTAVSGIVKTVLLYSTLIIAGVYAWRGLAQLPAATVWHADWLWPQSGNGWRMFATNCLSVIIGVAVTQSYAQALYSARDAETAARGSYLAAALCMPVGLPLILIGIHTHFMTPSIDAVTALPMFMQMHLPALLAGLGVGAILLSIIGADYACARRFFGFVIPLPLPDSLLEFPFLFAARRGRFLTLFTRHLRQRTDLGKKHDGEYSFLHSDRRAFHR